VCSPAPRGSRQRALPPHPTSGGRQTCNGKTQAANGQSSSNPSALNEAGLFDSRANRSEAITSCELCCRWPGNDYRVSSTWHGQVSRAKVSTANINHADIHRAPDSFISSRALGINCWLSHCWLSAAGICVPGETSCKWSDKARALESDIEAHPDIERPAFSPSPLLPARAPAFGVRRVCGKFISIY